MISLTKGKVIAYLVALFLVGVVAGAVGGYASARQKSARPPSRPREIADNLRDRLRAKLDLTPAQFRQIEPLMEQHCAEAENIRREMTRRYGENWKKFNQQLAAFLTPEQKQKLEQLEKERPDWGRRGHGRSSGGTNRESSSGRDPDRK
jgi:Spy/CpxP family protein refolding chaperone